MSFRWPNTQQHTLILGSTGSGKSVFGLHALSNAAIERMPYVIIDFKDEEMVNSIPHAHHIDFKDKMPKQPGIYILPAQIETDNESLERFMAKAHRQEKIGFFFDEGFMLPHMPPRWRSLNALYTQGRSKNIQTITLSQRPNWISRFAFSEAAFIAYMRLNDVRDRKTVSNFVPTNKFWDLGLHPREHHVKWFDVGANESYLLKPAPEPDAILNLFDDRLKVKRKVYL